MKRNSRERTEDNSGGGTMGDTNDGRALFVGGIGGAGRSSSSDAVTDEGDEQHRRVSGEEAVVTSPDDDGADDGGAGEGEERRLGTTSSARFNILSTMVGGGSLSLPLAFQKSGNALLGPVILIAVAVITEFVFRIHVVSARITSPVSDGQVRPGNDSFESVTRIAFGPSANVFSMALVTSMCFFGTVGYAVLLRDMLQPITDKIWNHDDSLPTGGPTFHNNLTMLAVCLLVTPLCTLRTLTALKRFGAFSMFSILILGVIICYRSIQCNMGEALLEPVTDDGDDASDDAHKQHFAWKTFKLLPDNWKDLLDVFPLFVSCYVCHYNLLPVHNEFKRPSAKRVAWWLRSTTWMSTAFYLVIGISGSAYGHCTPTGNVQGNILLDFDEMDPLLFVGRMCLAITITLAFPMLTIPARDILIRSLPAACRRSWCCCCSKRGRQSSTPAPSTGEGGGENSVESLREPLLEVEHDHDVERDPVAAVDGNDDGENQGGTGTGDIGAGSVGEASLFLRLVAAVVVFWSAAAVASCVSSIDVVWDLLGSSLSILLSYLIPCGTYLVIANKFSGESTGAGPHDLTSKGISRTVAWFLIAIFVPLMILSTANAVYDTFLKKDD